MELYSRNWKWSRTCIQEGVKFSREWKSACALLTKREKPNVQNSEKKNGS